MWLIRATGSPSTYKDFLRVRNQISKLPTKLLDDAIEIRDYLTNNFEYREEIITNISACCDWGIDSKLIKSNPLRDV